MFGNQETNILISDIPAELFKLLNEYISTHPDWTISEVVTASVSVFLMKNMDKDKVDLIVPHYKAVIHQKKRNV